ncbi:Glutathione-independent formaldehyde dehydrogenase [Pseudomonas syringae pv. cilantro]|uniref:Glutathione-independent formaldehyde dehydrogenase n=2 Tax=Pseudomonas syringae group TaxID=136849 RepID=A0A0N0GHP5_PSESX|nr:Glutathione-independent formaldehyde dehydrogenase [Pseudomonas syringae pv. cilantro]KPW70250.1 Glutathione-independent formaldehyde dehydrogenase [Pseudomonas syringae pv. coriandricola]RMN10655.1 Glutathione-independent formaldehyde dehydrogenase [Pseudomonas syringae pv. coriandricola]
MLNSLMGVVRVAGKIGIPGPYVNEAPDDVNAAAKMGGLDDDEFDAGVPKKVCD